METIDFAMMFVAVALLLIGGLTFHFVVMIAGLSVAATTALLGVTAEERPDRITLVGIIAVSLGLVALLIGVLTHRLDFGASGVSACVTATVMMAVYRCHSPSCRSPSSSTV